MKLQPWTWYVWRLTASIALLGWSWKVSGILVAIIIFVAILIIDASAYFDGVSVGEARKQ